VTLPGSEQPAINMAGIFFAYGLGGTVSLLSSIMSGKDFMSVCVWFAIAVNISQYPVPTIFILIPLGMGLVHAYRWISEEYYEPVKTVNRILKSINEGI
jgi:hypothetical protein